MVRRRRADAIAYADLIDRLEHLIVYAEDDGRREVIAARIAHRREVYRS